MLDFGGKSPRWAGRRESGVRSPREVAPPPRQACRFEYINSTGFPSAPVSTE